MLICQKRIKNKMKLVAYSFLSMVISVIQDESKGKNRNTKLSITKNINVSSNKFLLRFGDKSKNYKKYKVGFNFSLS